MKLNYLLTMERPLVNGGKPCEAESPYLGLWTHDPRYPRIFSSLANVFPSLVVDDQDDEDMTDMEDWAFLYDAPNEKPAFCGVCSLELDGSNDDEPMVDCDGGYCTNSWYHFSCVGLIGVPTSGMFFSF